MSYEQQTYSGATNPAGEDPGKTMGIVGLILAFVFAPAGIIVSYLAKKKSAEAGFGENQLAKWGFILGIIFTVIGVIGWILYFVLIAAVVASSGGM